MKIRILPLIGLGFSVLLLARAISVSSEVLPNPKKNPGLADAASHIVDPLASDEGTQKKPLTAMKDTPELCLTGDVLAVLKADKENLSARLAAVEVREKALETLETKLNEQMEAIEAANSKIETQIGVMKAVANDDIVHLVQMYQTMKPKQAAAIFESMDPAFAAGFLREMNGERAGLIMANMDSRKSYSISVMMASKNASYR